VSQCTVVIKFEAQEEYSAVYSYDDLDMPGLGYRLSHGHCPNCNHLIVVFEEGKYVDNVRGGWLSEITKENVIFPNAVMPKALEPEIPQNYRDDFKEAYAVLPISSKASAM
jgi:hypothetical protein